MSNNDEVFGLPFLFTGGLPTALEKFTEGNLKCFLIYLIEVSSKANRLNVWKKPSWWNTDLIPYSPIEVDTSSVPPSRSIHILRELVSNCYRYYNAERILEVSKQLSELPRIFLKVKEGENNTRTLYDAFSKMVYVTVRSENLTYDARTLDVVSKCWQETYKDEDVTFCEIKNISSEVTMYKKKDKETAVIRPINSVITVSSSDDEDVSESCEGPSRKPPERKRFISTKQKPPVASHSYAVIQLSDSDDDSKVSENTTKPLSCDSDDDVQYIGIYNETENLKDKNEPQTEIIVLTDSDDDQEMDVKIISSHSLSVSPNKNILRPLESRRKAAKDRISRPAPYRERRKRRRKSPISVRKFTETPYSFSSKRLSSRRQIPLPFPPSPPPPSKLEKSKYLSKDDVLSCLSLVRRNACPVPDPPQQDKVLERASSFYKCPVDWFKIFSQSNKRVLLVSKGRKRNLEPYENYCSTNPSTVRLSIQLNSSFNEDDNFSDMPVTSTICDLPGGSVTVERWSKLDADQSRRRRRAATRYIRSCLGDSPTPLRVRTLVAHGTLAPKLACLPQSVLSTLLQRQFIRLKDFV